MVKDRVIHVFHDKPYDGTVRTVGSLLLTTNVLQIFAEDHKNALHYFSINIYNLMPCDCHVAIFLQYCELSE